MVCRDFILPEPASYVFFYDLFNLRKLLYLIFLIMAAANPGVHRADGRKCSGKVLLFAKTTPQTAENKKLPLLIWYQQR